MKKTNLDFCLGFFFYFKIENMDVSQFQSILNPEALRSVWSTDEANFNN